MCLTHQVQTFSMWIVFFRVTALREITLSFSPFNLAIRARELVAVFRTCTSEEQLANGMGVGCSKVGLWKEQVGAGGEGRQNDKNACFVKPLQLKLNYPPLLSLTCSLLGVDHQDELISSGNDNNKALIRPEESNSVYNTVIYFNIVLYM